MQANAGPAYQELNRQFALDNHVTLTFDFFTSGSTRVLGPAVDYISTDFPVDSSSRLSFQSADRQTDGFARTKLQTQLDCRIDTSASPALVTRRTVLASELTYHF